MKNILRNHYSNYARPCLNCPFNSDAEYNLCSFTASGEQDCTCPLYKKWTKSKKNAYNIKITLSLENHINQIDASSDNFLGTDIDIASKKLIKELKKQLNARQFQAFELLFIKNMTDEEAAQEMGFKSTETGREGWIQANQKSQKDSKRKSSRNFR